LIAGGLLLFVVLLSAGCGTMQRATGERFSLARQDQLVSQLGVAAGTHRNAHDQVIRASEAYEVLFQPLQEGGTYRERYDVLGVEFTRTEQRVREMGEATKRLERMARDYFVDWEARLYEFADPTIREASRRQLDGSRREYERILTDVRRTQARAERVTNAFGDQVRFLRHNLNQQALSALQQPAIELQLEFQDLLTEMDSAAEALDYFAASLRIE
jgi:hypothetical protein